MNKEQILQLTGLSEDDFYDQYPDQESFCQDYPDMCPEMIYDDSLYEAQDGVETTAPYTDYNQYKNAMQTHFNEVAKANLYNSFQNDLYAYANKKPGFFETNTELQELFNSLSPKQQDALAQKYNAEFITNTPNANRKNYINSMEMNIPGKGMGYYSFPTNDVVYGRKVLERPNYEFPKLAMTPYQSEDDNKPIQILNNLVNLYKNPSFLNSKNGKSPIEKYSLNKTVEKVGAANKYISKPIVSPSTNYTSIVDLLKSRGEDSSFESRKKLAEEAGIKNYIGTASQNMKLLNSFNNNEMKHGGIHINPTNKGKFTSWAQAHGMGVQQAASHVMANKEDYSATIVKRANFAKNASKWKHEEGGDVFPAMRTMFKHGGYYGMDGKFHPNSDSGTYVGGAGYYFEPGGTTVTPSTPPGAGGNPIDITTPNSFAYSNPNVPDANGFYPDGSFRVDQNENYNFDNQNETNPYMTGDPVPGLEKEDDDDEFNNTFDDSPYSNQIDPNTGFTTWSKNNKVIRNIKKEDPALWGHLKEEGHGARWATGQTDFQRVGRTVGKIGQGLESAINVAGAIGGYLSNRQKQQNLDKSAMNKGSTASMFTNPEGSSKGDYGVTGSAYGMFKPNQMGNYSFKGMYGKYGMEVPRYDIGGGFSNLFGNAQTAAPISNPMELAPNISIQTPLIVSPTDNTRVATQKINSTRNDIPSGIIDVDLALQAVAGIESSSKPGETKVGMRTKLVGKTGKKATASGTYQITEPTLKDIYNNNSNFNKTFKNFNEFKLAFDSNPEVEYAAAKSLMSNHIKNYGIYALGAWYQPSFAKRAMKGDKSVYDIIPSKDEYGNKKTWGQDFKEKLNAYNKIAGTSYNINSSISTKSPSVNIKNLHPNLMQFTNVISQTFPGLVLTSGNDSKHMKGSKHYNNKAIDIGANTSNKKDYLNLKNYLKNNPSIKKQYGIEDIIDEGDHLHIELMKKGGQFGGQVVEMDENEIQQFLKAGGQLEFID